MTSIVLNTGVNVPQIGLGTWQSGDVEVEEAVLTAIKSGYRHIDCAYHYGNETAVGKGLLRAFEEGLVKRDDVFITSKLPNAHHRPDYVKKSLTVSLERLGLKYLDLYLIHWPHSFKTGDNLVPKDEQGNVLYDNIHYLDTWKVMEECHKSGLAKSIGVSNFSEDQMAHILKHGTVKPAINQVEIHPFFSQEPLVNFCHQNGIKITAYSPLGSANRPWKFANQPVVLENETLKQIGAKHRKSVAQVTLRWLIQRGLTTVPKSCNPRRIQENINVFDFELSEAEMKLISGLNTNTRMLAVYIEENGKLRYRDRKAPHWPWNDLD